MTCMEGLMAVLCSGGERVEGLREKGSKVIGR